MFPCKNKKEKLEKNLDVAPKYWKWVNLGVTFAKWGSYGKNLINGVISVKNSKTEGKNWNLLEKELSWRAPPLQKCLTYYMVALHRHCGGLYMNNQPYTMRLIYYLFQSLFEHNTRRRT
jgi:hypothetical protein